MEADPKIIAVDFKRKKTVELIWQETELAQERNRFLTYMRNHIAEMKFHIADFQQINNYERMEYCQLLNKFYDMLQKRIL